MKIFNSIWSKCVNHWIYLKLCFFSLFCNTHLDQSYAEDVIEPTIWSKCVDYWIYLKLCFFSLFCNVHLDQSYAADVVMEPMIWFVDNFTKCLGPLFVACVVTLMSAVIVISYWIGLPYWWERNCYVTVGLLVVGHWLLVNTLFHYYMGVVTPPGYPPQDSLIPEAVSICKKCIAPKPPRTHHCSVCNRCVLKMDHHCPWLNNCVGHYNHRYFYMYMIFIVASTLFIMVFGFELAYTEVWLGEREGDDEELVGHPVRFNNSGSEPVVEWDEEMESRSPPASQSPEVMWRRRSIIFMAFICSGAFVALGCLSSWHANLIARGETSIEAHINKSETKRLAKLNKIYINPYNFGRDKNWRKFLGLERGRSWWHLLLPSRHKPEGDGLTWDSVFSVTEEVSVDHSKVS
ncbi:palmitoyltransferase ZDHHC16-like isoform X2 [Homalodisca vitripennis]|uniref:palmitoyltransferase ZDHHC16-like isoform X2 n=1 Tax=Homalodisca vitripennis TaxID=197043 RepID=UPI001EEC828F|nr:palmitoyltransferase ZDHHC16-like isoform X2 [Homalodisca vitripennis]